MYMYMYMWVYVQPEDSRVNGVNCCESVKLLRLMAVWAAGSGDECHADHRVSQACNSHDPSELFRLILSQKCFHNAEKGY